MDALTTLVVCRWQLADAARKLWPEATIAEPREALTGTRVGRIVVVTGPSYDHERPWYDMLHCRLAPGGEVIWLV